MTKTKMFQDYHKMPKNFMTPNVLKFKAKGNSIIELSKGVGFDNKDIYGVTELIYTNSTRFGFESSNNSKMFDTRLGASRYYNFLTR